MRPHPDGIFGRAEAAPGGEFERQHQTHGDRFAVEKAIGIAGLGLKRVRECVAEVEQYATAAGLALVLGDDTRLASDAGGDRVLERLAVAGEQRGAVLLQPGEESRVFD